MTAIIINRLKMEDDIQDSIAPRFLSRNWSPAFKEWSTKAIRDAFFSSPSFRRLLNANAIKETIAKSVREGDFAYVWEELTISNREQDTRTTARRVKARKYNLH